VPPFNAIVELAGHVVSKVAWRPAIGLRDVPEIHDESTRSEKYRELWPRCVSTKQQNGLRNNVFKIALRESSSQGSAIVMKKKRRRPNSADIRVGESIRAHRLIVGMSQSDLARKLGVSFQQVQKYEKGMNRVGAGLLPQIAETFDIPIGALFDANAETSGRKGTGTVPAKLIPDRNTLELLNAFGGIAHRKVRYSLVDLVNAIAKATSKSPKAAPKTRK
jgi:transcriptional regulator with XRE-family HTH domain